MIIIDGVEYTEPTEDVVVAILFSRYREFQIASKIYPGMEKFMKAPEMHDGEAHLNTRYYNSFLTFRDVVNTLLCLSNKPKDIENCINILSVISLKISLEVSENIKEKGMEIVDTLEDYINIMRALVEISSGLKLYLDSKSYEI